MVKYTKGVSESAGSDEKQIVGSVDQNENIDIPELGQPAREG